MWLVAKLLGRMKDIAFMGNGFYHVTMMPETNICKIIESGLVTVQGAEKMHGISYV